jgi:chromate transporter
MRLDELFWTVLRVSWLTFGGGGTAITLLEHEIVDQRGALAARDLLTAVAIGRFCPGPNSLYISSLGYMLAGWPGAIVALVAMLIPCLSILPVEWVYGRVRALRAVQGFATGVSVGATGLIVASVWTLSAGAIVDAPTLGIAVLAGLLVGWRRVSAPLVIGAALALGLAAAAAGVW